MSGKMKTSQEIKYIKGYLNLDYSTVYIFGEFVSSSVVLLAAPSNLPIQVLILLGPSPVQCSVHQLSLIILMESQLK